MPGIRRTVALEPAAEIEYRRLTGEMPDFEEAYEDLMLVLCEKPRRGWPLSGGRWGYSLARPGKPRVRVVYTFNETGIRLRDVQATPAGNLPAAET